MEALKLGEMRVRKTKDGQNILEQDVDGTGFVVVSNFSTAISEGNRGRCVSRSKNRETGEVVVDWDTFEKTIDYFDK